MIKYWLLPQSLYNNLIDTLLSGFMIRIINSFNRHAGISMNPFNIFVWSVVFEPGCSLAFKAVLKNSDFTRLTGPPNHFPTGQKVDICRSQWESEMDPKFVCLTLNLSQISVTGVGNCIKQISYSNYWPKIVNTSLINRMHTPIRSYLFQHSTYGRDSSQTIQTIQLFNHTDGYLFGRA